MSRGRERSAYDPCLRTTLLNHAGAAWEVAAVAADSGAVSESTESPSPAARLWGSLGGLGRVVIAPSRKPDSVHFTDDVLFGEI
jgi:hypothetical protein